MRIPSVILIAAAAAALAACEGDGTPHIAGLGPTLVSSTGTVALVITPAQAQIAVGTSIQLATNVPLALQNQVEWGSVNPFVASVTPAGLVTGATPGTATIRARLTSDTTNVAVATVQVVP